MNASAGCGLWVKRSRSWLALLALLACCGGVAGAGEGLSDAALQDLYSEGKALFRQANEQAETDGEAARALYRRAVQRFERVVREGGIHNGKLYYNIGNIHFRLGDLGRAILYYRRAERYIPDDVNLQQNLAFARRRRADLVPEKQEQMVLKTVLFWHYDLSLRTRSILLATFCLLFWGGLALRLLRPGAVPRAVVVAAGVVALLLFGSILYQTEVQDALSAGVVVATEVVGRKGDGETYQPSFKEPLHAGTEFVLVERRAEWMQVELADGRRCWLPRSAVELLWPAGS